MTPQGHGLMKRSEVRVERGGREGVRHGYSLLLSGSCRIDPKILVPVTCLKSHIIEGIHAEASSLDALGRTSGRRGARDRCLRPPDGMNLFELLNQKLRRFLPYEDAKEGDVAEAAQNTLEVLKALCVLPVSSLTLTESGLRETIQELSSLEHSLGERIRFAYGRMNRFMPDGARFARGR
jgi:hypothetical protein